MPAVIAVAVEAPGKAALTDLDVPEPAADQVKVRVRRVGLCGSDLSTFLGKNPMVSYPRVLGHEVAATIEAVGSNVPAPWKVGMNVTFTPYTACGACSSCKAGRTNACRNNQTMGVQRNGALAESAVVPASRLFTSAVLNLDELALVEPFSVGFHVANRARVREGETVLVMGCGGVGLGAIAGAASHGARVVAMDVDDGKLALAKVIGATLTINSAKTDAAEVLKAMTDGEGPPVIIEAVGAAATYRQAVEWVAYCGRVVYIGYGKEPVAYETKLFVAKELDIMGSRNCLTEFGEVISFFEKRTFDPRVVISQTIPLQDVPAALDAWGKSPAATSKIMVRVG